MSPEIIRYDPIYQKAVIDLWRKCDLVVPQNDPGEDIQRKLAFQPELFFIAVKDGQVVGSIMVGYDGHRGWLNYVAVLPAYQKRGFGKKLIDKAIDELGKLGCVKVNVQVRRSNPSAVGFYEHLGFKDDNVVGLGLRLN